MLDLRRRQFLTLLGGAAAAWPLAARAQQSAIPVIGFMSSRSPEDSAHLLEAFRRGLREGGFIDGENVAIKFRWVRGDYSRLPTLATDLVSRRVNVISALGGPPSALAAKRATSTIPIVSSLPADPTGLIESFNRPGGNITGFAVETDQMDPKRLGLLRDLAPGAAIYQFREYAVAGGLLSYGVSITDAYRECGVYTAKILKGAKPTELPVLQSTKFELVINLKTANALGVKISDNLLSLADEVIE
jgi:ABC-type uncharacterized transport system substrate-binding protein